MFHPVADRECLSSAGAEICEVAGLVLFDDTVRLYLHLAFENVQDIVNRSFFNYYY